MDLPGMGGAPNPDEAFAALGKLNPKSANPTESLTRIREAFDLAEKLMKTVEPQVSQINSAVYKDVLQIRQRIVSAKAALMKDMPLAPPPDLMLGMGGQGATPSFGAPSLPGGVSGGGALP